MEQRFLDAVEVQSVEKEVNRFQVLAVDCQVESTPSHVIHTVDVQWDVGVLQGLPDDWNVPESRSVQVDSLLVGQLRMENKRISSEIILGRYPTKYSNGIHESRI